MTASFTRAAGAATLRHRLLMNAQQKLEIGQRIKELRGNSPETNRSIADYCDVAERTVAHWIAGDGITYDNAERVAELFQTTIDWIWRGREKPGASPLDVLSEAGSSELPEALGAMRSQYAEVLGELSALRTELRRVLSRLSRGDNDLEGPGS